MMFMNHGMTHRGGMGRMNSPASTGQPAMQQPMQAPTGQAAPSDPNANAANPNTAGNQMGSASTSEPANPNPVPNVGGNSLAQVLMGRMGGPSATALPNNPSPNPKIPGALNGVFGGNMGFLQKLLGNSGSMGPGGPQPPAQPTPQQGVAPAQPSGTPAQPVGV